MSKNQTVLITGASKGIGLQLAELFAKDGYDLILIARSATELGNACHELKIRYNVKINYMAADLSQSEAAQQIFDQVQKDQINVDILVNNAGFGNYGLFHQNDLKQELDLLQVNINSVVKLTHLFLQPMIARRQGKILNIASTAAFLPGPLMANYYASKAYVLSFSQAIANELKDFGIQVSVLCPGPTKTHFNKRAGLTESKLFQSGGMNVKKVATAAFKGLMKGQLIIIPGFANKIIARLPRFVPSFMAAKFARNAQEKVQDQKSKQ